MCDESLLATTSSRFRASTSSGKFDQAGRVQVGLPLALGSQVTPTGVNGTILGVVVD
jgi:hypothetical protein